MDVLLITVWSVHSKNLQLFVISMYVGLSVREIAAGHLFIDAPSCGYS